MLTHLPDGILVTHLENTNHAGITLRYHPPVITIDSWYVRHSPSWLVFDMLIPTLVDFFVRPRKPSARGMESNMIREVFRRLSSGEKGSFRNALQRETFIYPKNSYISDTFVDPKIAFLDIVMVNLTTQRYIPGKHSYICFTKQDKIILNLSLSTTSRTPN